MHRTRLSGKVGAGLDPCAAIQIAFDLADGQEREIVFRLGAASSADAASLADTAVTADPRPPAMRSMRWSGTGSTRLTAVQVRNA